MASFTTPISRPWWEERGITRLVAGVFEGGGAKGVLYDGALQGMLDERCWFGATAGASAGAITATAIAIGLQPQDIGEETKEGLEALQPPTRLNGLLRIHDGGGYFDQDRLRDWLQGLLERQVGALCGEPGGAGITFGGLHSLTGGFELDIVAVDLARQHRVVFNYMLTPDCSVASAVVASAAIPLLFESRLLNVPDSSSRGVIVDGGVLANFPSFVFEDRSYREWAGLPAVPYPVVGFLLDEATGGEGVHPFLYRESDFLPVGTGLPLASTGAEWRQRRFRPQALEPSVVGRVAGATGRGIGLLTWPFWKLAFEWIPAALRWNAAGREGDWPKPRTPALRALVGWFDAVMASIRPWGVFLGGFVGATLCIGVGAYHVAWRPLADHVAAVLDGDESLWGATLGTLFMVLLSLVPIYAWIVVSLVFSTGWLLHRTLQVTGYSLVRTFLAGSGAPVWTGAAADDHVVRLRVPTSIDTLRVGDEAERNAAVRAARDATRAELQRVDFGQ